MTALTLCLSSLPVSAETFIGFGAGSYSTKGHWVPIDGTADQRENQRDIQSLRLGRRWSPIVDVEASVVWLGKIKQSMSGKDASGNPDARYSQTSTYGLELAVAPRYKWVYAKAGGLLYLAKHNMSATKGDVSREVGDWSGLLGFGLAAKRWRVEYSYYNNMYTRNSDLGGYDAREEFRHLSVVTATYSF